MASFSDLPDEVINKIIEHCDDETLKNFGLTSRRNFSFLKEEKNKFRLVRRKITAEIKNLDLSSRFNSLNDVEDFDQIKSDPVGYGISAEGYEHTFRCFNHVKNLNSKLENDLDSIGCVPFCNCKKEGYGFFILASIGILFLAFSFVCLGGANDSYEKYPDGKIHGTFSSSLSSAYSLSSLYTPSFIPLTTTSNEFQSQEEQSFTESLFRMEQEYEKGKTNGAIKKNEQNGNYSALPADTEPETTQVLFLWRFTTAAVLFCISALFFFFMILFHMVYKGVSDYLKLLSFLISIPVIILLIILTVIPAIRMDEFTTSSYWLHFIPYFFIGAVGLFGGPCLIWLLSMGYMFILYMGFIVDWLFVLAGLFLCVLRLEETIPSAFGYTIIFIFPIVGVFLFIGCGGLNILCFPVGHGRDSFFKDVNERNAFCIKFAGACVLVPFSYAGFFLPFCLRKDLVFRTSFHYTLIPWYLLIVGLFVFVLFLGANFYCDCHHREHIYYDQEKRRIRMKERIYELLVNTLSGVTPVPDDRA